MKAGAVVAAPARVPSEADWEQLRGSVRGRVFLPGDAGYRMHTQLFNRRYQGARHPLGVVCVAGADDLRQSIRWARDHTVPVVARSAGHSFAGYSVNDGLVLDLSRISLVRAEESTGLVTVGGGARLGQVYDAMRPYEMAFSGGTNPIVGVAGLALGGGCEFASRKLGLTADAMVETTLVGADGALLRCNESENADLFWACRGGGGGNFGINVSFTFQATPVTDVATASVSWRWRDAARVLPVLQATVERAPFEFSARLGVSTSGRDNAAARQNATIGVVAQLFGSARELKEILGTALNAASPLEQEFVDRTFWEAKTSMVHATSGGHFAMRSNYALKPIGDEAIAAMLAWIERWPGSSNSDGGGVGLFAWGGEINRRSPEETALVHRDTLFLASMDTSWEAEDGPDSIDANLRWLDGLHRELRPHLSAQSYQNFVDPDLKGWEQAYYGSNLARLRAIKRAYDPDNVFRFDQSIPVEEAVQW